MKAIHRGFKILQIFAATGLIILVTSNAFAGTKIGNGDGGDAVYCQFSPGANLPPAGYYSLDYLATMGLQFGDTIPVGAWQASASRIEGILVKISDDLATSFAEYVRDVRNTSDYTRPHVWEIAPFGLMDVQDEHIVGMVPENCQQNNSIKLVQAVVHQNDVLSGRPDGARVYSFVPQVLDELERTSPLQLSFLYVHEWLWKHSDNVVRNRRINRFLHSALIDRLDANEIRRQLSGMGFDFSRVGGPNHSSTAPNATRRSVTTATESVAFQKQLFAQNNYCESRKTRMNRWVIGGQQNFKFYSVMKNTDLSSEQYAPFSFKRKGSGPLFSQAVLHAQTRQLFGDMFQLTLDGGDIQFVCTGSAGDHFALSSSAVKCLASTAEGPINWPNSEKAVSFQGDLYPGCFVARSEATSLGMPRMIGQFMIVGEF